GRALGATGFLYRGTELTGQRLNNTRAETGVWPFGSRVSRSRRESPVKGSTRGNDPQVSIENDKRLPNAVNDGLRQGMPMRHGGQRVAIGHAGRFLSICAFSAKPGEGD